MFLLASNGYQSDRDGQTGIVARVCLIGAELTSILQTTQFAHDQSNQLNSSVHTLRNQTMKMMRTGFSCN